MQECDRGRPTNPEARQLLKQAQASQREVDKQAKGALSSALQCLLQHPTPIHPILDRSLPVDDAGAANPLAQHVVVQCTCHPPALVEDLLWYIHLVLIKEGPVDPIDLAEAYQRHTGLPSQFNRFLSLTDGPVAMVARLSQICMLQCIEGVYSVNACMSACTTRLQFEQRCACYRQALVDNVDALNSARDSVERVKESLRQREQRRHDQWHMDNDMGNLQFFS